MLLDFVVVTTQDTGWTCTKCGSTNDFKALVCAKCFAPKPASVRSKLPSFGIMDTGSFVLPVQKRLLKIWVIISLILPLIASSVYFLYKTFHK
jgi:hypothetical protein